MSNVAALGKGRLGLKSKKKRNTKKRGRGSSGPSGVGRFFKRTLLGILCLALLAGLGVGLLVGHRWVTTRPYFAVKEIEVTGNSRLSHGEIVNLSELNLGQSSLEVKVGEVKRLLETNPWVESVSVKRVLPGTIKVDIRERQPFFWVLGKDGELMYAEADGDSIEKVVPGKFASFPLLKLDEDTLDWEAPLGILVSRSKGNKLPFNIGQMAWVDISRRKGLELYMDGKRMKLRMGLEDFSGNLERLCAVWRDLDRRKELGRVAGISSMDNKVWVRRRG